MVIPRAKALASVQLGQYQPLLQLATGGMATLYVARKVGGGGFERLVAIKRVHPHLLENEDFHEMFRDEARVCSVIRHANVVSMTDVVDAEGELFLVLDYVESLSLGELIRAANDAGKRLPPAIVSRIVSDALAGLHAAHEATDLQGERLDVIHRDVSPQNIIVGVDGTSRLIDFGIAKAVSRISVTNSGVVKGKLRYMSPEQVRHKELDRRSDIFAAGLVLFEALTGKRLLGGDDEGDIALAILLASFPTATSVVAELPPAIDAVLEKALAREPEERYQRASEFADALERAVPAAPAREVGALVEDLGMTVLAKRRDELRAAVRAATPLVDPERARRIFIALGAACVVTGAAFGAFLMIRSQPARSPAEAIPSATTPSAAALEAPTPSATTPAPVAAPTPPTSSLSSSATPAPPVTTALPGRKRPRTLPPADLHRKNPYAVP
jgi:serine/threonine-protein kinase